jgi:pimeloyl-ACP methyl ester carboxylesterase
VACAAVACLQYRSYSSDLQDAPPVLVIALHGDAPRNNPAYQYIFAQRIAERSDNTIAVGLLRPGYTDRDGRVSGGRRGRTTGRNYDAWRVARIADAIEALRDHYQPRRIILAGHSGGSAITAKLIALHPGLVDEAFIVSCPCDIPQWRAHMYITNGYEGFNGEVELVDQIPLETRINILIGREDTNTLPAFSEAYYQALGAAGREAEFTYVDGDHEIFLGEDVIAAVVAATED